MEHSDFYLTFDEQKILFGQKELFDFIENPYGYFKFLKSKKQGYGTDLLCETNTKNLFTIKSNTYYELFAYKLYLCELVYNGINLFPEVCEYVITCKNDIGTSFIAFGIYADLGEDGHPVMAKYINTYLDEVYCLSLKDISDFYCNNRYHDVEQSMINIIVSLMLMGGKTPTITTSYKINNKHFKNMKFIKEF